MALIYQREQAVDYAHQWAFGRNPRYLNFTGIGGDCTNFISQCLLAGGAPMNGTKTFGWYYYSANDRAPAWTGVQFLYNFLMRKSQTKGPYGERISLLELQKGDLIQLAFSPDYFTHDLLVVQTGENGRENTQDNILIATHSEDSDYRPLSSYEQVVDMRFIRIGIR